MPPDSPIELRFDRLLLPKTANRQALTVYTGSPNNYVFLTPRYDVLERVVTYRPAFGSQFIPGVVYHLEIFRPSEDPNGFGFKAFDGAGLERGPVPLTFSFRTSRKASAGAPAASPPSCEAAVATLTNAGCTGCHDKSPGAPFGLSLASPEGLRLTAIGQVSHELSTWATPGTALADAPRFGTGMAIVDPGNPASSFLIYKLIGNPRNFREEGPCTTAHTVRLPRGFCPEPPAAERTRLADWFVQGDPMPPDDTGLVGGLSDLRSLTAFIESGTDRCH